MSINQLYPFERNRYYPGKMLTSADLEAEQNYHMNKDRFLNGLLYGKGVICGLDVTWLDDLSIIIESGAAIDGTGREVIVDKSVVKKLSAIDGYDDLKGDQAFLKLRYHEKAVHSVYSVNHKDGDKEYEYNRIAEDYEFFLSEDTDSQEGFMDDEFLLKEVLFKSTNYIGTLMIPRAAAKGRNVKLVLLVNKLSDEDVSLSLRGVLEMPVFLTPGGEHDMEIGVEDLELKKDESFMKEYWVSVMDVPDEKTELILRSGSLSAFENEQAINVAAHFSLRLRISEDTPLALVSQEIGHMSLEARNMAYGDDAVPLALIRLVRQAGTYIIESIEKAGIKNYIMAPAEELTRNKYLSYFMKDVELLRTSGEERTVMAQESRRAEFSNIAAGTLEVPLGRNAREGDIRYSGEIAHGLGPGHVYVDVGYHSLSDDPRLGTNQKSTIYGNPELFSSWNDMLANVETAVKVLDEKGTFIVAARLLRPVDYLVLSFNWVAIRFPSGNEMELTEDYYDKSISVNTPTVILGPKESHFFGVRFNNMKKCSITYELTHPNSGEISSDGIYTAPSKDGVYEIRIYCTDMPVICTYAYAIVKKKMVEDAVDEDSVKALKTTLPGGAE
ncbi:MAG: hypothetical protein K5770_17075 [Lachnospiraceae bacterium]|nr:hypothetical protein [Lachnospiraceae bacterium]